MTIVFLNNSFSSEFIALDAQFVNSINISHIIFSNPILDCIDILIHIIDFQQFSIQASHKFCYIKINKGQWVFNDHTQVRSKERDIFLFINLLDFCHQEWNLSFSDCRGFEIVQYYFNNWNPEEIRVCIYWNSKIKSNQI